MDKARWKADDHHADLALIDEPKLDFHQHRGLSASLGTKANPRDRQAGQRRVGCPAKQQRWVAQSMSKPAQARQAEREAVR